MATSDRHDAAASGDMVRAIVHDYFTQQGGAERFAGELARRFPNAPVHASVVDPGILPTGLVAGRVRATRLQRLRSRGVPLAWLAPLLPTAFGRMRFDGPGSVVVSSTSAFAHHIRVPDGARHVAYCHSPPHFLWDADAYFGARGLRGRVVRPVIGLARASDRAAAARVDVYVANSRFTADRILEIYGRQATVIHPPIDVTAFEPTTDRSGRFLVVARLRRHKRLELAMAGAGRSGVPLDIIGDGPDEAYLRRTAPQGVRFLGRLGDEDVAAAMARCSGLIVPAVEDFGLTMAEVQAAGRPPIAFARGGALEIVDDGETGFLVPEQTVEAFAAALARAESTPLDPDRLVRSARRFDRPAFDAAFGSLVAEVATASVGPGR